MCGIAGWIVPTGGETDDAGRVDRVLRALRHRGQDQSGSWSGVVGGGADWRVTLVHTRLGIVDRTGGRQPMADEAGVRWMTCDGEIYNHLELRCALEARGHRFCTHSDTEAIVHLWEELEEAVPDRLRGMFAFALWNGESRRLWLVRDRWGIKPLYFARLGNGGIAFASEPKGLWASAWMEPRIDFSRMAEHWALGFGVAHGSLYQGVEQVEPGTCVSWAVPGAALRSRRYWSLPLGADQDQGQAPWGATEWVDRLESRLTASVREHLMGDQPVGLALSGGVDSALLASLMRRETGAPVATFSVGYTEAEASELTGAREVAELLECEHHEVVLDAERFWALVPKLVWHMDGPIRWPSSIALFSLAQEARKRVRTLLTGEGCDELFAGYARYGATVWNRRVGRWGADRVLGDGLRDSIREGIWSRPLPDLFKKLMVHSVLGYSTSDPGRYYLDNWHAVFEPGGQCLSGVEWAAGSDGARLRTEAYAASLAAWERATDATLLRRMLYTDLHGYLVGLLQKLDRMGMAANLEGRVPYLDHELVEAVWGMPDRYRYRGITGKWIVRRLAGRLLPRAVSGRRKRGFPTPIARWLREPRGEAVLEVLLDEGSWVRDQWGAKAILGMWNAHKRRERDHAERLWLMLTFEFWHRTFIRKRGRDGAVTW
ncbi:MAG: asparagine synthase (glutamine-hydrolyzing) [Verrucomicrobiota bacterium]|nr:asparagine synthase (glutamine-hydrolyzing) [Verrucomicrobiota bacterium]